MGDINPSNILVKSPRRVYLVDTDSYQVEGFPCTVGMINFTAPEIHKQHNDFYFLRTFGNEYFAVATLLFMIMLPGKPPYSHQGGGDPKENIVGMNFSYPLGDKSNKKTPDGPWRYMWSHLPYRLKEAFYNTFSNEGEYSREEKRLSVDKWIAHFNDYYSLLDTCILLKHTGKLIKQDKMSGEIFPSRFKKNPNITYYSCSKCRKDVDENHFRDGLCIDCFRDAPYTTIKCSVCGRKRTITNGEFEYYKSKGLELPKRCKSCIQQYKSSGNQLGHDSTISSKSSLVDFINDLFRKK